MKSNSDKSLDNLSGGITNAVVGASGRDATLKTKKKVAKSPQQHESVLPSSVLTSLQQEQEQDQSEQDLLMVPLMMATEGSLMETTTSTATATNTGGAASASTAAGVRSRLQKKKGDGTTRRKRRHSTSNNTSRRNDDVPAPPSRLRRLCPALFARSTLNAMNFLARIIFWSSLVALVAAVVWYSYELANIGTESHLVFWFSAGAFVLLGFPISMYGIVMHLANYNQPNVQCYIVRILWMVPIYSIESWLCLRFHKHAIYIETLRDCYESYVLYSFLQYLIQVLGGEEELILMLKDKSPTRGVHMWGLQWCVRPWLMGQPVSRTIVTGPSTAVKRVHWTSPFFVRCKFGTLQYVLLKFVSSIFVMILELSGLYKEGNFTIKGGYLYICILTNLSQCWALYCLIFFYFATKNELSPINPVGKFLAVKALVFFTWWQSVGIAIVDQLDFIPDYQGSSGADWTSEAVAKGFQDYLICIEMFFVAIVLTCVFPHTDYLPAAVAARKQTQLNPSKRRLGRKRNTESMGSWLYYSRDDRSACSKNSCDVELASQQSNTTDNLMPMNESGKNPQDVPLDSDEQKNMSSLVTQALTEEEEDDLDETEDELDSEEYSDDDSPEPEPPKKTGFVRALLDSTIPTDVIDNSVGIVKGDYKVEKKTLLYHATTSDQYDLFSRKQLQQESRNVLK